MSFIVWCNIESKSNLKMIWFVLRRQALVISSFIHQHIDNINVLAVVSKVLYCLICSSLFFISFALCMIHSLAISAKLTTSKSIHKVSWVTIVGEFCNDSCKMKRPATVVEWRYNPIHIFIGFHGNSSGICGCAS
jgi:hypothetical protein